MNRQEKRKLRLLLIFHAVMCFIQSDQLYPGALQIPIADSWQIAINPVWNLLWKMNWKALHFVVFRQGNFIFQIRKLLKLQSKQSQIFYRTILLSKG